MRIEATDMGEIVLKEVYSGVMLETNDGEFMGICMRDTGFEFYYGGSWYSAKNGLVEKLNNQEDYDSDNNSDTDNVSPLPS